MSDFTRYTSIVLSAYLQHGRPSDIINKQQEIIDEIIATTGKVDRCLCVGWSPLALVLPTNTVHCFQVSEEGMRQIASTGKSVIEIHDVNLWDKCFDLIIAADEYLTFAETEEEQLHKIRSLAGVCKGTLVTTLRDYKNQDHRDKEFSQPVSVRNATTTIAYLEQHLLNYQDRNSWITNVYGLAEDELQRHAGFNRRNMFFKQLAKFARDSGAVDFNVHKSVMYKSMLKRNYEHIISIKFKNE
jgi:hypothetical protein